MAAEQEVGSIAFLDRIRARLFGDEPEPEEKAPPPVEAPAPPPPPPVSMLQLPPDHPVQQLWQIYREETGWNPPLQLCLETPERMELSEQELKRELLRLQMALKTSAAQRLKLLTPPKPRKKSQGKAHQNSQQPPPPEAQETPKEKPPRPDLDAQPLIYLSENGLLAWLMLYPPVGKGAEPDQDGLLEVLHDRQVQYGVDEAQVRRIPQEPDRFFRLFPVACGTPPIPGIDGRVMDLFPRVVERKIAVDEHNRVDYMSLSFVQNVEAGAVICRIIPPSKGTPGRTVQDQAIDTRDGKPAAPPKGRNTALSEDGTKLLATIAGHVEFSGRSFQVKPLLEIQGNVDYSTGNINYLGDVHIHGDICSGFTVRAMGNITVDGVVEACSVEAGGDLVVARGIRGDDRAVIRAQKNLYAKYLENCCIYVRETLHTDSIINCDVYCDGGVEVRSGRMTIVGGRVWAAHEISAGTVGSRTDCRTDLTLGGHPCEDFDHNLLRQEVQQLSAALEAIERQPDSPDKFSRAGKTRMQLTLSKGKLEMLEKDRAQRQEEPEEPGVRRLRSDTVHAGTVLEISGVTYRFERQLTPCSASLVNGEIQLI